MANSGKILAALLLGAAAGAAIGVLFAPEKGSETRKKIAGKASELTDELTSRYNKGREAVNDLKEKVAGKAEDLKNSAQTRVNDFRDAAEETRSRAKNSSHTV
jgi:gas vesicle protein